MNYLRDIGRLWGHQPMRMARACGQVVYPYYCGALQGRTLAPKREYSPLFEADRLERFGEMCKVVGATGFEPATS